ncbi:MAG: hypothetical protein IKG88_00550 [Bacteroidales bacterium]|nr:hypothetical protein [Bacteroidales bacterium]
MPARKMLFPLLYDVPHPLSAPYYRCLPVLVVTDWTHFGGFLADNDVAYAARQGCGQDAERNADMA